MIKYELLKGSTVFKLYTSIEESEGNLMAVLMPSSDKIDSKLHSKVNGTGQVELGSNNYKSRSSEIKIRKIFLTDIEYQNFTNELNQLLRSEGTLTLKRYIDTSETTLNIISSKFKEKHVKGSENRIVDYSISFTYENNYWLSPSKSSPVTNMTTSTTKIVNLSAGTFPTPAVLEFTPGVMAGSIRPVDAFWLYIENVSYKKMIRITTPKFGERSTDKLEINGETSIITYNGKIDQTLMDSAFPLLYAGDNKIYLQSDNNNPIKLKVSYKEANYV